MSPEDKTQRSNNINIFYDSKVKEATLALLAIVEPQDILEHGQLSRKDLFARAACAMAREFETFSGHPLMELLKDQAREAVKTESEALPLT